MRFSLSTLIVAVLLIGLYLAAARLSTNLAAQVALSLTVLLLVAGLAWGLFRPGADRPFAIGFQACGWGYLLLAFSQLSGYLLSTHLLAELNALMPFHSTSAMVEWGGTWWSAEVLTRRGGLYFIHYTGYDATSDEWVGPNRIRGQIGPFLQIGNSLLGLIMALTGGVIARCLSNAGRAGRWFWIAVGVGAAGVIPSGIMAVVYAWDMANSVAVSLLFVVLFLTTLAALILPADRVFAAGFSLIGWGYLLLHLVPGLETSLGPQLLTSALVNHVSDWLHPATQTVPPGAYSATGMRLTGQSWTSYWSPSATPVRLAGHALLALLFAGLGGCIAVWLSRRKPVGASDGRAV